MSRNADIRRLLREAPSTTHEIAALLGLTLRDTHVGLWVLTKQGHVRKSGATIRSETGRPRKLFEITDRGRHFE